MPLCYRGFAAYPNFLEVQWRTLKPLLGTREFFELAARLRAETYTYVHNYLKVPPLGEGLTTSTALECHRPALPCRCRDAAADERSVAGFRRPRRAKLASRHPADRVAFGESPEFVDLDNAPIGVRAGHGGDATRASTCRSQDRKSARWRTWPELLFAYWQALKPSVQSVFHEQAIFRARESAWSRAPEIPLQIEMDYARLQEAGVSADDIAHRHALDGSTGTRRRCQPAQRNLRQDRAGRRKSRAFPRRSMKGAGRVSRSSHLLCELSSPKSICS